ncbi:MAG: HAD family phosphatase [Lachnospiraceae bacterium]|nr:HAD family phosphatase [Lachnospiraceae bacterium]
MIRNIVFDIGMVLADFRWKEYMLRDLGFAPEVMETFAERLVLDPIWDEFDLGVRPTEEIIAEMKEQLPEYPKERELFFSRIEDIAASYPYSEAWIRELKERGFAVYLLSNYPRDVFRIHEKKHFAFAALVDGKVVSGFERVSKPDLAIYRILLERYGLRAEECVFLDDRKVNIDTALSLGMQGIVFTSYEDARGRLEELFKRG